MVFIDIEHLDSSRPFRMILPGGSRVLGLPVSSYDFAVKGFFTRHGLEILGVALEEFDRQQRIRDQVHQIQGALGGSMNGFQVVSPPKKLAVSVRPPPQTTADFVQDGVPTIYLPGGDQVDAVIRARQARQPQYASGENGEDDKGTVLMMPEYLANEPMDNLLKFVQAFGGQSNIELGSVDGQRSIAKFAHDSDSDDQVEDTLDDDDDDDTARHGEKGYLAIEEEKGDSKEGLLDGMQLSPPESIRTEATLDLGDDDHNDAVVKIVSSLPLSSEGQQNARARRRTKSRKKRVQTTDTEPTHESTNGTTATPTLEQQPDARVPPSSPVIVVDPVTNTRKATEAQPSHAKQQEEALVVSNTAPDSPTDNSSPETPLVTPREFSFGSFRKQSYPTPKYPPSLTPMGTIPMRAVSLGRSPLSATPPVTASTFAYSQPGSLTSTRQNSPAPSIVINEPASSRPNVETLSSAVHVVMTEVVKSHDPASLHDVKLNHAYTLSTAHAGAVPKVPAMPAAVSADLYSSDLVPIFTAYTFGDFFGSWKALRRAISQRCGRPIEAEGSTSMIPLTEGLGLHLCFGSKTLQFFRQGVKPMWEDPMCAKGGKIMLVGKADELDYMYFRLVLSLIAGCFEVDCPSPAGTDHAVVGIVYSKREKHSRVEVWLGGRRSSPPDWVKRVEGFLRIDVPGQWTGYKSFHQ